MNQLGYRSGAHAPPVPFSCVATTATDCGLGKFSATTGLGRTGKTRGYTPRRTTINFRTRPVLPRLWGNPFRRSNPRLEPMPRRSPACHIATPLAQRISKTIRWHAKHTGKAVRARLPQRPSRSSLGPKNTVPRGHHHRSACQQNIARTSAKKFNSFGSTSSLARSRARRAYPQRSQNHHRSPPC